jgi:hypothetical protein
MKRPQPISVSPPLSTDSDRDRMEIIRFSTADDQRHAIRALMDRGMLSFSSDREDEWLV